MANLWAGPYVGEFGWELFYWQGYVRKLAHDYDKVIMACRKGHEALYEDFSDHIETYEGTPEVTDCERASGFIYDNRHTKFMQPGDKVIFPWATPYFTPPLEDQEFVTPGEKDSWGTLGYDIIVHARNTDKFGTAHRNWPEAKWTQFATEMKVIRGYSIASMGTPKSSLRIRHTDDIRGANVKQLSNLLYNSGVAVGPSSGPLHLASLNKCPHVGWGGPRKNVGRYKDWWNPLETPCEFIEPNPGGKHNDPRSWDADIVDVVEATLKMMRKRPVET